MAPTKTSARSDAVRLRVRLVLDEKGYVEPSNLAPFLVQLSSAFGSIGADHNRHIALVGVSRGSLVFDFVVIGGAIGAGGLAAAGVVIKTVEAANHLAEFAKNARDLIEAKFAPAQNTRTFSRHFIAAMETILRDAAEVDMTVTLKSGERLKLRVDRENGPPSDPQPPAARLQPPKPRPASAVASQQAKRIGRG